MSFLWEKWPAPKWYATTWYIRLALIVNVVCFLFSNLLGVYLGGDAAYGFVKEDHYFLSTKFGATFVEVSSSAYWASVVVLWISEAAFICLLLTLVIRWISKCRRT